MCSCTSWSKIVHITMQGLYHKGLVDSWQLGNVRAQHIVNKLLQSYCWREWAHLWSLLSCYLWGFWMCLSMDCHFFPISLPSPDAFDITATFRWLMTLCCYATRSCHSPSWQIFFSFFATAVSLRKEKHLINLVKWSVPAVTLHFINLTFSNLPYVALVTTKIDK